MVDRDDIMSEAPATVDTNLYRYCSTAEKRHSSSSSEVEAYETGDMNLKETDFRTFFQHGSGFDPFPYQVRLAEAEQIPLLVNAPPVPERRWRRSGPGCGGT